MNTPASCHPLAFFRVAEAPGRREAERPPPPPLPAPTQPHAPHPPTPPHTHKHQQRPPPLYITPSSTADPPCCAGRARLAPPHACAPSAALPVSPAVAQPLLAASTPLVGGGTALGWAASPPPTVLGATPPQMQSAGSGGAGAPALAAPPAAAPHTTCIAPPHHPHPAALRPIAPLPCPALSTCPRTLLSLSTRAPFPRFLCVVASKCKQPVCALGRPRGRLWSGLGGVLANKARHAFLYAELCAGQATGKGTGGAGTKASVQAGFRAT